MDTTEDALILFEAARLGVLKRVSRRLFESERNEHVKHGVVFVWDEEESGIQRWTDGRQWTPSRVHGACLSIGRSSPGAKAPELVLKRNGLIKKAISITTATTKRQHLVSYYSNESEAFASLRTPSSVPELANIVILDGMYPDFLDGAESAVKPAQQTPARLPRPCGGGQDMLNGMDVPTPFPNATPVPNPLGTAQSSSVGYELSALQGMQHRYNVYLAQANMVAYPAFSG